MIFQIECSFQCTLTNDAFGHFQRPNSNPFNQPLQHSGTGISKAGTLKQTWPSFRVQKSEMQRCFKTFSWNHDLLLMDQAILLTCWHGQYHMNCGVWTILTGFCRGCCPSTVWLIHRFWVERMNLNYGPVEDRYRPSEKHLVVEQVWMPWYTVSQASNPSNLCYLVPSNSVSWTADFQPHFRLSNDQSFVQIVVVSPTSLQLVLGFIRRYLLRQKNAAPGCETNGWNRVFKGRNRQVDHNLSQLTI